MATSCVSVNNTKASHLVNVEPPSILQLDTSSLVFYQQKVSISKIELSLIMMSIPFIYALSQEIWI